MAEKDLELDWDLFQKPRSSERPVAPWLCSWASTVPNDRPIILVEEGQTELASYQQIGDPAILEGNPNWVAEELRPNLIRRIKFGLKRKGLSAGQWSLIRSLLVLPDLTIEGNDSLKDLIDQGLLVTKAFKAIWEARFMIDEGQPLEPIVNALGGWLEGRIHNNTTLLNQLGIELPLDSLVTTSESLDVLFMLLTLSSQNDLLDRLIIPLAGLDLLVDLGAIHRKRMAKDLYDFILAADRWSRIVAPIGVLLTGRSNTLTVLEGISPTLGKLLKRIKENSR